MKPDPAKVRAVGEALSRKIPVEHDTPRDMLKLLKKLG